MQTQTQTHTFSSASGSFSISVSCATANNQSGDNTVGGGGAEGSLTAMKPLEQFALAPIRQSVSHWVFPSLLQPQPQPQSEAILLQPTTKPTTKPEYSTRRPWSVDRTVELAAEYESLWRSVGPVPQGVRVVTDNWLGACLAAGRLISTDAYELQEPH
jgi:hypothetical protein